MKRFKLNLQTFGEETPKDEVEKTYAQELLDAKARFEDELRAEREAHARDVKELTQQVINGGQAGDSDTPKITAEDVARMRTECFSGEISNLKFVENMCKIRDYSKEHGLPDPFIPHGEKAQTTPFDEEVADRVEEAYKTCIEYAKGDSALFTQELQRITKR